ncbi:MAG: hypothetical protein R3F61_22720 [Myxococcota bacterium]
MKVDFFTVPGQSFYQATRRVVLEGVDGIVFVADSSPDREDANVVSREDLVANLQRNGKSLDDIPHVYQWNKRDVPRAIPLSVLERYLNPEGAKSFEAVAVRGEGIWETQSALLQQVFDSIRQATQARSQHG